MRTVGSVLKKTRIAKGLTLDQVADNTKIKTKVLEHIESDEISKSGSFGHAQGLIKNYGEFLELDTNYLTALFRRQTSIASHAGPKSHFKFLGLTTNFRAQILTVTVLALIFGYLIFQLASLQTGPKLVVAQPEAGTVVNLSKIRISGVTDNEAKITINGQSIPTNLSGEFSAEFELTPGVNQIEIVAEKSNGARKKIVRTVEFNQ